MRLAVVSAALLIGVSCARSSTAPAPESELVSSIFVSDGHSIRELQSTENDANLLYTAAPGLRIRSFVVSHVDETTYLALIDWNQEASEISTSLVRVQPDGSQTELLAFTRCDDCEGYSTIYDLHLSPDERFLAIDRALWEGAYVQVLDLQNSELVSFTGGPNVDRRTFVAWDSHDAALFVRADNYLLHYDIREGTRTVLPTLNVRDYVFEADLLEQGYVGMRVDYESLIGERWPRGLDWHPAGWNFAFERRGDCILFNMMDSTESILYDFDHLTDRSYPPQYRIQWNADSDLPSEPPEYGNADIVIQFDSTSLDSLIPLNDSVSYEIGTREAISYLDPTWNGRHGYPLYYFKESLTVEKVQVVEIDFFFREFAFHLTPSYWTLLRSFMEHRISYEELTQSFASRLSEYDAALEILRTIRYPGILHDRTEIYETLVTRDYQFQQSFLQFLQDEDLTAFSDSVHQFFRDQPSESVDSVLAILGGQDLDFGSRLDQFYREMHNRFLNYYGFVIAPELEQLMRQLHIEQLYL